MKALFALLAVLIVALAIWAFSDSPGDQASDSASNNNDLEKASSGPPDSNNPRRHEPYEPIFTETSRTRVIDKKKPQGLTATWHPEKKGIFISPYNQEEIEAIGVVSGSKVKDSDGNEVTVPPFEDSPTTLYPIGSPVPERPGYVFNPYTQSEVDVRGLPPGVLVQDPNDPDRENHRFRTPGE